MSPCPPERIINYHATKLKNYHLLNLKINPLITFPDSNSIDLTKDSSNYFRCSWCNNRAGANPSLHACPELNAAPSGVLVNHVPFTEQQCVCERARCKSSSIFVHPGTVLLIPVVRHIVCLLLLTRKKITTLDRLSWLCSTFTLLLCQSVFVCLGLLCHSSLQHNYCGLSPAYPQKLA